jgi:hypothetical protein
MERFLGAATNDMSKYYCMADELIQLKTFVNRNNGFLDNHLFESIREQFEYD